jgi:hypothetical protein
LAAIGFTPAYALVGGMIVLLGRCHAQRAAVCEENVAHERGICKGVRADTEDAFGRICPSNLSAGE